MNYHYLIKRFSHVENDKTGALNDSAQREHGIDDVTMCFLRR